MTKIPAKVKELLAKGVAALREAWATEPTRVLWFAAGVIVFVFAKFGIVVNQSSVLEALAFVVPLIVGGAVNRSQVAPTKIARVVALARLGSKRRIVAAFLFHRTALAARKRIEAMQDAARAEESLPEDTEPARAALRARYGGEVTVDSKLKIAKATHKERGRWVILASS